METVVTAVAATMETEVAAMADKKYVYVENVHNAPITCTAKDEAGRVVLEKKFNNATTDKWSGRQITTGFERLTQEEYKLLCERSRTFVHYKDNPKKTMAGPLLILHEDLPPEARTPHEALAEARKESRKAGEEIKALKAEITKYKADLLDAQEKYRKLESASTDAEALQNLKNQIAKLTDANEVLTLFVEDALAKLKTLAADEKVDAAGVKALSDALDAEYAKLSEEDPGKKKDPKEKK